MTDQPLRWPSLEDGERELTDTDELLHRQVHPAFILDSQPGVAAFSPTREHGYRLSTARGQRVTAEQAYQLHGVADRQSAGTWSVAVGDVHGAALRGLDDSARPDMPAHHASVDFRAHGKAARRVAAEALRTAAVERGATHVPSP